MEFKKLFEPIMFGPVEIKNRIVLAPMNVHMANADCFSSVLGPGTPIIVP